jgi:hypothetical protein
MIERKYCCARFESAREGRVEVEWDTDDSDEPCDYYLWDRYGYVTHEIHYCPWCGRKIFEVASE